MKAKVGDGVSDLRVAVKRGSRGAQEIGDRFSRGASRVGRDARRRAKDVAVELLSAAARRAQRMEQQLRRRSGDEVLDGFPRVIQLDKYSCGVQCTKAILSYFGHDLIASDLQRELRTTKRAGTDWNRIMDVVRSHGCRCRKFDSGRRETLIRAIRQGAPVLVEVDGDHWAVVYGIGPDQVYLADPSPTRSPMVVLSWQEFRGRWDRSGVVVKRGRS